MSSNRILSVVDPTTDAQPAVERAARLAKALNVGLELFVCDYDQHLGGGRAFDAASLERARRESLLRHTGMLEQHAATLASAGLDVIVDARWCRGLDRGIIDKVVESQPVLVAKDTHRHGALKRTPLSNTDWNLIRGCPAPLMLVKPRPVGPHPIVLAAVDPLHEHDKPAELDRIILGFAMELRSVLEGRLQVLHSYDVGPILASMSAAAPTTALSVPAEEIAGGVEREHREALDALVGDFRIDAADVRLEQGPPHDVLVQQATKLDADFVVMGAVSRSGFKRIFLGSTAERSLDRLPCDLVIVKPPGFPR